MPGGFDANNRLVGHERYAQVCVLNRGAFGVVVLAYDHDAAEHVALKFIERGPEHITKYVEREIVNHMRLRHPHVVKLREVFLTSTHLVLAMEYVAGGDLYRLVTQRGGLSEPEARWFFQQLVVAIDYCHSLGVSSRDIKMENTLLDGSPRPLIKLADFGFSKDANAHSAPTSRVGTPAYLAPEVVGNPPGHAYDGQKADIWSCGVLLFIMATGTYPFSRDGDSALGTNQKLHASLQRILRAEYDFPQGVQLSEGVRDLLGSMLRLDPAQRISLQGIQGHPWFLEGMSQVALDFNRRMVQDSLAQQPPKELLDKVRAVVAAAAVPAHELQERRPAQRASNGAGGTGAVAGARPGSDEDLANVVAADAAEAWDF